MALATYDGAPTVHRHLNAAGELVGTTEVESPWDDATRAEAEALWEAERLECPQCGNLREECSDPAGLWYPQRHVCYATREREAADRRYGEKHKAKPFHNGKDAGWSKDSANHAPYHFREGVRIYVAPYDVNPDDGFI